MRRPVLVLAAAALAAGGMLAYRVAPELTPAVPAAAAAGAPTVPPPAPPPPATLEPVRLPPRGGRAPQQVAPVRAGLRCPDGSFLPLLNGVPEAPPIERAAHLGALPPVVAVLVDDTGCAWYEHADGSVTTTRFRDVIRDGVHRREIETLHNAPLPAAAGRQLPADGR